MSIVAGDVLLFDSMYLLHKTQLLYNNSQE